MEYKIKGRDKEISIYGLEKAMIKALEFAYEIGIDEYEGFCLRNVYIIPYPKNGSYFFYYRDDEEDFFLCRIDPVYPEIYYKQL
jgi:hypothetical protein